MSKDKLKWAALGLAVGIMGGSIGAAAADKWLPGVTRFETIEAREILIRNEAGKPVAGLRAHTDGGGMLAIYNEAGEVVAGLIAHTDGGMLAIYNEAGKPVARLP